MGTCSIYTVYRTAQGQYVAAGWTGNISVGTSGINIMTGTSGPDLMLGLGGGDIMTGLGGDDVMCGGDGNDFLLGNDGNDILDGGNGSDVLNGGNGDYDQLYGGDGNDVLLDGDGVLVAQGGVGTDAITLSVRNGWRDRNGQARFEGVSAGYGDDVVALAILDPAVFFLNITGDERDTPPSPLEGNNDSLAVAGNLDPASVIIKFENRVAVGTTFTATTAISDDDGAEYLTPDGSTTVYLPIVSR